MPKPPALPAAAVHPLPLACALLALFSPAMAAPPAPHGPAPQHRSPREPVGDLPNFAEVAPGIYRGGAPTAAGLRRLKEMGVETVIDLRIEKKGQTEEEAAAKALGLDRLRIPLGREAPTAKQVRTFLATLDDPAKRPVYVHCHWGADRTGAMIGIYRVTRQNWGFDRAYKEMRRYGFKSYLHELKGAVASRAKS